MWDDITYPFPNFNGCTVEVWEWISNFIPPILMDVIIYPCWYYSYNPFIKGARGDINTGSPSVNEKKSMSLIYTGNCHKSQWNPLLRGTQAPTHWHNTCRNNITLSFWWKQNVLHKTNVKISYFCPCIVVICFYKQCNLTSDISPKMLKYIILRILFSIHPADNLGDKDTIYNLKNK